MDRLATPINWLRTWVGKCLLVLHVSFYLSIWTICNNICRDVVHYLPLREGVKLYWHRYQVRGLLTPYVRSTSIVLWYSWGAWAQVRTSSTSVARLPKILSTHFDFPIHYSFSPEYWLRVYLSCFTLLFLYNSITSQLVLYTHFVATAVDEEKTCWKLNDRRFDELHGSNWFTL